MTETLLSMALCLVLIVASSLHSVRSQQVASVGAILDFSNVQGEQSNVSLHLALEDINQNFLNSSYRLQLIVHDSSAYKTTLLALDIFKEEVIALIVQEDVISETLSPIAIALDIPLLSLSDYGGSSRDSATSVLMPSASDEDQMECIAALFSNFFWKEAAVIVEDGEVWLKAVFTLEDTFWNRALPSDTLFGTKPRFSLMHLVSTNDSIAHALDAVQRGYARVTVVHASAEVGLQVLREADELGMLGEGYAWIVTEPLASSLESFDDSSLNIMQGILGVRRFVRRTQRVKNLFERIRSSVRPLDKLNCLRAYNSLWMVAQAFQSVLDESHSRTGFVEAGGSSISVKKWSGGRMLSQKLEALNSTTFTNPLQENDREMQIVNVVERRVKAIGFWDRKVDTMYYSRGGNASAGKNLGAIVWPGDTSYIPTGFSTIEIGVIPDIVFPQFVQRDNTSKANFSGFCVYMFQAAIKQLPYALSFQYKEFNSGAPYSSNYDSLIKKHATQEFYAGVGDVTILAERWKNVTFTKPYTQTGLGMMVKRKTKGSTVLFLYPFSKTLWAIILFFFFITAGVLWFSEHRHSNRSVGIVTRQLITSVSFSFAALTTFNREKVLTSLARGVLVVWLLTGLIITNTYTARLSSILTSKTMVPEIKKMKDLANLANKANIRVGFMNGSFVKSFLTDDLGIHETQLVPLQKPEEYASALQHSHVEAIVDEIPYIDIVDYRYCNCNDVAVVQEGYYSAGGFGFFLPKGSPFVADISTALLKLSEDWYTVDAIREEWLGKTHDCFYLHSVTQGSSGSIHVKSLRHLFISTALLYALCAAIFIANNRFRKQKFEPNTTPERKEDHVSLLMAPANEEGSSRIQIKQDEPESSSTSRSGRQKCLKGEEGVEDGDELGPSPSICSSVSRGESVRTVEEPWMGMEEAIGAPDLEYLSKITGPSRKGKDKGL